MLKFELAAAKCQLSNNESISDSCENDTVEVNSKKTNKNIFFIGNKKVAPKLERVKYKKFGNYLATFALHILTAAVTSITAPVVESVPKST